MLKGSLRSRLREIEVAVVDKAATLRVEMLLDNERLLGERWNGSPRDATMKQQASPAKRRNRGRRRAGMICSTDILLR